MGVGPCPSLAHTEGMSTPTRSGRPKLTLVRTPPTFEAALAALLGDRPDQAAAMFATRVIADPADYPSRANHVIALYNAERYVEATEGFRTLIDEVGPRSLHAVPMFLSLGYCLLQLEDEWGSLVATTGFLDHSNEKHPFYAAGLENTACAWEQLGAEAEAKTLRRAVHLRSHPAPDALTRKLVRRLWSRSQIIATSYRILGVSARPRPARRCSWPVGDS